MKKIIKLLLIIFLVSINITILKADCESDKALSNNITVYESNYMKDGKPYLGFDLENSSDGFYAEITNTYNDDVKKLESKNGVITYSISYGDEEVTVKALIYSSACPGEPLREINVVGNKLNVYSELDICNEVLGGSQLCTPTADTSNMSKDEFVKLVSKDMRKIKFNLNISRNYKKYILYAIIPFFVIGFGYVIAFQGLKRKQREVYKKGRR